MFSERDDGSGAIHFYPIGDDVLRPGQYGGADREVDEPVGVGGGGRPVRGQAVPGEVGQARGDAPARRTEDQRVAQWSWFCGGSAATIGWSWSISPIFAAPPGEPRSSKKCTLAS